MKCRWILPLLLLPLLASGDTIKKINGDHVLHISKTHGKCRELRALYYPTFNQLNGVIASSVSVETKIRQIMALENKLPSRIQIADTLIRARFTRPLPETDIDAMPTAASSTAKEWDSLYDAIPGLKSLPVRPSPFFDVLYDFKEEYFLQNLRQKKEGFYPWTIIYDCDTVLELGNPTDPAGKRILFFQSDLDIDADGSDGKRHQDPRSYSKDGAFQPETSYRWKEKPGVPNPFLKKWEARRKNSEEKIALLQSQLAKWRSLKRAYGHQVEDDIKKAETELALEQAARYQAASRITDVSQMRHLVGELDPFIVVPLSFTSQLPAKYRNSPYAPKVGDYAMVFYGKKIYPAIVGDEGPTMKCGEASLALARQIRSDNPRLLSRQLSAENSPFWDLEVSYLVFPGTAKDPATWGEPNLANWNAECFNYIQALGGLAEGFEMHRWKP